MSYSPYTKRRGFWETFARNFGDVYAKETIIGNLYEKARDFEQNLWWKWITYNTKAIVGDQEREEIEREEERQRIVLGPEELKREYGGYGFIANAKNPMTRAEADLRARREKEEDLWRKARYTGVVPEWMSTFPSSVAAYLADPFTWGSVGLSWGLLGRSAAFSKMLNPTVLASKTWKARGTAAAIAGIEGFVGEVIYGTGSALSRKLVDRPYTAGEFFLNAMVGAGLGGAIGAAFPRHTVLPWAEAINTPAVNFHRVLSKAEEFQAKIASDYRPPLFDNKLVNLLAEENSGVLDLRVFQGETPQNTFNRLVESGKIKIVEAPGPSFDIPKHGREALAFRQTRPDYRPSPGLVENTSGEILAINGRVLAKPHGRFLAPNFLDRVTKNKNIPLSPVSFPEGYLLRSSQLYLALVPGRKSTFGAPLPTRRHLFSNNPRTAAELSLLKNGGEKQSVHVAFAETGGLRILDLTKKQPESFYSLLPQHLYYDVKAESFRGLSGRNQAAYVEAIRALGPFDGIAYKHRPNNSYVAEVFDESLDKLGRMSSQRIEFQFTKRAVAEEDLPGDYRGYRPPSVAVVEDLFSREKVGQTDVNLFRAAMKWGPSLDIQGHFKVMWQNQRVSLGLDSPIPPFVANQLMKDYPIYSRGRVVSWRELLRQIPDADAASNLRRDLKSLGFIFDSWINPYKRMDRWALLDELVVPRQRGGLRFLDSLVETPRSIPDSVPVLHYKRTIDLFKHPMLMDNLERRVALSLAKNVGLPTMDTYTGVLSWPSTISLPRALIDDARNLGLGIAFKVEDSKPLGLIDDVIETSSARDFKAFISKLEKGYYPEEVQGPQGEIASFYNSLFSQPVSKGDFHMSLLSEIHSEMSGKREKGLVDRFMGRFEKMLRAVEDTTPESLDIGIREEALLSERKNIESLFLTVTRIREGGVKGLSGEEFVSLLKERAHKPFATTAHLNLETQSGELFFQLFSHWVNLLEDQGIDDETVKLLLNGVFDLDLLKIKHFHMKKRKAAKETSGGKVADEFEAPRVSEQATKIYNVMRRLMSLSQRIYTDSGLQRGRIDDYIGINLYDTNKIYDAGERAFIPSLLENTTISPDNAKVLYDTMISKLASTEATKNASDDLSSLTRTLVFRSAEHEMAFLKRWGKGRDSHSLAFLEELGAVTMKSHLMNGFYSSLEGDAQKAALAGIFTKYPKEALDIYRGILERKVKDANRGVLPPEDIKRIKQFHTRATYMIDEYLTPARPGTSTWYKAAKVLRDVAVSAKLTFAAATSAVFDYPTSALVFSKYLASGGGLFKGFVSATLGRLHAMPPGQRVALAKRLMLVTSVQQEKMGQRFLRDYSTEGLSGWLATASMRHGFLPYVTDVGRVGNYLALSSDMLSALKKYPSIDKLPERGQQVLGIHGIGEETWQFLRQHLDDVTDKTGVMDFVNLYKVYDLMNRKLPPSRSFELFRALHSHFVEVGGTKGVPTPSEYHNAFMGRSLNDPDSLSYNAVSLLAQFKAIQGAVWGVFNDVRLPLLTKRKLHNFHPRVLLGTATVIATILPFAAFNIQLRQLLKGKAPLDMDEESFWAQVVIQSGLLPIVGDIAGQFGSWRGVGADVLAPGISPVLSFGELTYDLGDELIWGDKRRVDTNRLLRGAMRFYGDVAPSFYFGRPFPPTGILNTFFAERWYELNFENNRQRRRRWRREREKGGEPLGEL